MKKVVELLVTDRPGVLDRVVGLIRRRGWNISSLTAGDIGGGRSLITMRLEGRDVDIAAVGEYFDEMDAVVRWQELTGRVGMLRELLIFFAPKENTATHADGVRILAQAGDGVYCEFTGTLPQVDAFAADLQQAGILCARSGPISLMDGEGRQDDAGK